MISQGCAVVSDAVKNLLETARPMAVTMLRMVSIYMFSIAMVIVFVGALRGAGDTVVPGLVEPHDEEYDDDRHILGPLDAERVFGGKDEIVYEDHTKDRRRETTPDARVHAGHGHRGIREHEYRARDPWAEDQREGERDADARDDDRGSPHDAKLRVAGGYGAARRISDHCQWISSALRAKGVGNAEDFGIPSCECRAVPASTARWARRD